MLDYMGFPPPPKLQRIYAAYDIIDAYGIIDASRALCWSDDF